MKVTELIALLQDAPEHAEVCIRILEHELAPVTKVAIEQRGNLRLGKGSVVLSTLQPLDLVVDHAMALRSMAPTPQAVAEMQQRMGWLRN
jgi:hypothetical protein